MTSHTIHCPLCAFSAPSERVYAHLQTDHSKSDLSRALLVENRQSSEGQRTVDRAGNGPKSPHDDLDMVEPVPRT